jgi:hypothetical protein
MVEYREAEYQDSPPLNQWIAYDRLFDADSFDCIKNRGNISQVKVLQDFP